MHGFIVTIITGYNLLIHVQEVDSKVGEIIYLLRKVKLELNLSNEQISIRNTTEIHRISKNSKNKHFKVKLSTDWLFYPNWPKL